MKTKIFILLFTIFSLNVFAQNTSDSVERRTAIDVGSGSTKITIADVDVATQKIISIITEESFPVPYQAALELSHDGSFDAKIKELGKATFRHIKNLSDSHQVAKIKAVATAAFREASNGEIFAKEIEKETGISVSIIPQREEGTLAYFSGLAAGDLDEKNTIVWDIGTGSYQMTTKNPGGDLVVFMGNMGSVPFKNYVIEIIQGKNTSSVTSPNPISEEHNKLADVFGRSMGRKAYPIIKEKIKQPETVIVGIGRLFSGSIGPMGDGSIVTRRDLRNFIYNSLGHTDEELNNPFASVDVTNAILVLSFMKALHIHKIHIIDTKSTRGMLIYAPYWETGN